MRWAYAVLLSLALVAIGRAGTIAKRNAENNTAEVCSYTFNVVAGTGETLSSGPSGGGLAQLGSSVTSQLADLEAKLDALLAGQAKHDDDTEDDDNGDSGGSTGVVYKRWGRKECPANATLIYKGN